MRVALCQTGEIVTETNTIAGAKYRFQSFPRPASGLIEEVEQTMILLPRKHKKSNRLKAVFPQHPWLSFMKYNFKFV